MIDTLTQASPALEALHTESNRFHGLAQEISKVIVGQKDIVHFISIAALCNGHILLEGVPGVAKTTIIKAITKVLGLEFNRIQFTPDLLPADLIGSVTYNPKTQEFETRKGPIFANLILADEINRAPAKVQSALLEAMQEQQVTIGSQTYHLDKPFLVFATQNPIEQEGTYRLPEAQVDRFMFKLLVDYPSIKEERQIVSTTTKAPDLMQILGKQDLFAAQQLVNETYVDDKVTDYIVSITYATRKPALFKLNEIAPYLKYGVSPRATIALYHAVKAHAFLKKRHFVTPDDVKAVAPAILRHRILLSYEAEAENVTADSIISKILATIPTP
jgi:MoxR-like ATPase